MEIHEMIPQIMDVGNICIADMPSVFAQMRGDAVRTSCLGHDSCPYRVRMRPAARVTNSCDMVDVHAKAKMRKTHDPVSFPVGRAIGADIPASLSFSDLKAARRSLAASSLFERCARQPATAQ